MELMLSWALWAPILIIFVATVIIAIVQRRTRDPCLKRFDNDFALVLRTDGKWVWGRMRVFPKSLVVDFVSPRQHPQGYAVHSYIFYEQNLPDIQLILRPFPRQGTPHHAAWVEEIQALRSPSGFRVVARQLRNAIGILRDAFTQSLGLLIGMFKQRTAFGRIAEADRKVNEVGQKILSAVPNSYEPILEEYLFREVAVEMVFNGQPTQHVGLLDDYTDAFLLLHDVPWPGFAPVQSLRHEDEVDRFSVLFARRAATVRHRVERNLGAVPPSGATPARQSPLPMPVADKPSPP